MVSSLPPRAQRQLQSLLCALVLVAGTAGMCSKANAAAAPGAPALAVDAKNVIFRFGEYEKGVENVVNIIVRNTGALGAKNVVLTATFSGSPETTPTVLKTYSKYVGQVFPCTAGGTSATCMYPLVGAAGDMRSLQLTLSSLPLMLDCRNKTATVTVTASADNSPSVTKTLTLPIACPKTADAFVHDFGLSAPGVARGGTFTAHMTFGEVEGPMVTGNFGTDAWLIFHLKVPSPLLRLALPWHRPSGPQVGTNHCELTGGQNELYCFVYRNAGTPPTTLDLPFTVLPATANPVGGCGPVTLQATVNSYLPVIVPDPNLADNTASATIQVTGCSQ